MRTRRTLIRAAGIAVLSIGVGGCGDSPDDTRIFVAASLADVATDWRADYAGQDGTLICHSGGSAILAQQIRSGAEADLFLSAGPIPAYELRDAGMVARIDTAYLANRVVIISRPGIDPPRTLTDITQPRYERIAIADPAAAPAGAYARAGLQAAGLWELLEHRMIFTADVRATLAAVATGSADVGFVYATDAATAPELAAFDPGFPAALYVLVMIAPETARKTACWDYLHSDAARQLASRRGFGS